MWRSLPAFVLSLLMSILVAGCITAIDESLPYDALPTITVATDVELIASPAHPTSYLPFDAVEAGAPITIIGADENAAWLFVQHENELGWIPTFYSASNIGSVDPPLTFEIPSGECTRYLDTITSIDEEWLNPRERSVTIIGSIFRPEASDIFDDAILSIAINGNGVVTSSDYVHTPLTEDAALILFTYSVDGLDRRSSITFSADDTASEEMPFQAAFFGYLCADVYDELPVGVERNLPTNGEVRHVDRASATSAEQVPAQSPVRVNANDEGFFDDFDGPTLDSSWYWLKENPRAWSLEATPGHLRITTDEGDMAVGCRNHRNLLLHAAPLGSFELQTKIFIDPQQNYQQGGLLVFDDQDNFVKLDFVWSDSIISEGQHGVIGIELLAEQNGKFPEWPWPIAVLRPDKDGLLLKLTRNGNWYDGAYSVDGIRWIRVGSVEAPTIQNPEIGLMAITGVNVEENCSPTAPKIPVEFDYFWVNAASDTVAPLPQ